MIILIAGDSLGLPRPYKIKEFNPFENDELAVSYRETYGFLLNQHLIKGYSDLEPHVINRSQRFATIKDIYSEINDYIGIFRPDIFILQVGIVDCWFREELNGKQLVPLPEYSMFYNQIMKLIKSKSDMKCIIIGICPTSQKMETRYPGIQKEIHQYNRVLQSLVDNKQIFYVDMEKHINPNNPHKYLLLDDHHLNKAGNQIVYQELSRIVDSIVLTKQGFELFSKGGVSEEVYQNFIRSFESYGHYIDNFYNLLYVSFMLGKTEIVTQLVEQYKSSGVVDNEVSELIKLIETS